MRFSPSSRGSNLRVGFVTTTTTIIIIIIIE
jgi:hypothetical protein